MITAIFLLLLGLALLIVGAESLVRGAASLAKRWGVSTLVIGLTIVAFGTSSPELIVNIVSAAKGTADIAVGNILGSNIANILLILGISSFIRPMEVKRQTVWREIPFAILAAVLIVIMGNDIFFDGSAINAITRTDGFTLMAVFFIFMFYAFSVSRVEGDQGEDVKTYPSGTSALLILGGLIGLYFGGQLLVDNAVTLARLAGLSEAIIGLTVVAVGTSLPELATSVVAAARGHNDIAIGNIVGSNIFNVFWVLGLTAVILQIPFSGTITFDAIFAAGVTILLFLAMFVGKKNQLTRWEGTTFLLLYVLYISYLVYRG
ncbi:MAG: calcium/sodium antiporter [Candidatus Nomurabacteria bacterium]|nr:MAG: calcium/sodium antiporter [Candidatus Nomurabacteria bacterium]